MLDIDSNEPTTGLTYIQPAVDAAQVMALNVAGWADYRWQGSSGRWTNVERKTWPEILTNVDTVEDQLRRHQANHPEARLVFVMEGWVQETLAGTSSVQGVNGRANMWVLGHSSGTRLSRIYSWLYAASEYVEVFQTGNYAQTCAFLVAAYKQDAKEDKDRKIFHRHLKEVTFHPNPQVLKLMAIEPGIGEKRAEALIDQFTTLVAVLTSTPEMLATVPGVGLTLATRLLQRAGRIDV